MRTGLLVTVYRPAHKSRFVPGDSTLGGVSSKFDRFILIGNGIDGPFKPDDETPALYLSKTGTGSFCAVPTEGYVDFRMFGGNFVYTCDSRFPTGAPIPIHDRVETKELYDLLSR